ncbi:hypothetical protein JHK86_020388 [Glycine max]|nr:hypothetical protein JHK86_020388 [Glycine max]
MFCDSVFHVKMLAHPQIHFTELSSSVVQFGGSDREDSSAPKIWERTKLYVKNLEMKNSDAVIALFAPSTNSAEQRGWGDNTKLGLNSARYDAGRF